jgi:hypothetical protein
MGEWKYSSSILDLGTRWRWVVSFTARPLYPRGEDPQYPLDIRRGGPQSRYRRRGVEKISCSCRQSNLCRPTLSPSLHRLSYPGSIVYRLHIALKFVTAVPLVCVITTVMVAATIIIIITRVNMLFMVTTIRSYRLFFYCRHVTITECKKLKIMNFR